MEAFIYTVVGLGLMFLLKAEINEPPRKQRKPSQTGYKQDYKLEKLPVDWPSPSPNQSLNRLAVRRLTSEGHTLTEAKQILASSQQVETNGTGSN